MRIPYEEAVFITAYGFALRSTCRRRAVGAVIVDDHHHVLSTGYNGVASGLAHCLDLPCPGAKEKSGAGLDMCFAIHAEQNAISHCVDISKAKTIFCTCLPCMTCTKSLLATPIQNIIYMDHYPHSENSIALWKSASRGVIQYEPATAILADLRVAASKHAAQFVSPTNSGNRH